MALARKHAAVGLAPIPGGSLPLYASQNSAGSLSVSLVPSGVFRKVYLSQLIITSSSPASQVFGTVLVSDGIWNLPFIFVESVTAGGCLNIAFKNPLIATNPNTSITATMASIGNGVSVALDLMGWQI